MGTNGGELRPGFLGDTEIEYNEFKFSEYTQSRWEEREVYDETGHNLSEIVVTLTVDTIIPKNYITGGSFDTADFDVNNLKTRLREPRKTLTLLDTGFGAELINSNNTIAGVLPINVVIENLGDGQTVRIVWVCEFSYIPLSTNITSNIKTVSVSDEYEISDRRRLTRVTKFVVRAKSAFQTFISTNSYNYSTDQNVNLHFFAGIGYDIETWKNGSLLFAKHDWKISLSADRRTATIIRTEKQIDSDNVYPLGVLEIDLKHRTSSSLDKGAFRIWTNEISGSITLRPDVPSAYRFTAWLAYLAIFRRRYELGIQQQKEVKGYQGTQYRIIWPRILSIEIEEELYNLGTITFRVRYDQHTNSAMDVFPRTGILQGPQTNVSDRDWAANAYPFPGNQSGPDYRANIQYGANTVNPAGYIMTGGVQHVDGVSPGVAPAAIPVSFYSPYSPQNMFITQTTCPPKDDSFRILKEQWTYASYRDLHRHERYKEVQLRNNQSSLSLDYQIRGDQANETDADASDQFYLVTGTSRQQVIYQGAALRYGGPTDPPDIREHGGKQLRLIDEQIDDTIISSSGCPTHLTKRVKWFEVVGTISPDVDLASTVDGSIRPELKQHS